MTITDRIDQITSISPEYRHEVLPPPRSVKIELTGRCNFKCAFCAHSKNLRDLGNMDQALFKRLLLEMREAGVEEIGLFYLGESFVLNWLEWAVSFAKHEAGFPYVFLTTNGSMASPARVKSCMENGLDSLKFSLNYSDEEQFAEIARVRPALFARVVKNIKSAYEIRESEGYETGLYASYILYDGEQGERMKGKVEELRPYLDEIYALPLYNQGALVEENGVLQAMTPGNRGRAEALRDPLPCWAMFTEGHISWDGQLTGCCFSHVPDFDFGDLKTTAFMEAWNSERAQWFRRHHLSGNVDETPCKNCVAV